MASHRSHLAPARVIPLLTNCQLTDAQIAEAVRRQLHECNAQREQNLTLYSRGVIGDEAVEQAGKVEKWARVTYVFTPFEDRTDGGVML